MMQYSLSLLPGGMRKGVGVGKRLTTTLLAPLSSLKPSPFPFPSGHCHPPFITVVCVSLILMNQFLNGLGKRDK